MALTFFFVHTAIAQTAPADDVLLTSTLAGCPSQQELQTRLQELIGATPRPSYHLEVTRQDAEFLLFRLIFLGGSREYAAHLCADGLEAAAVLMALAVDPAQAAQRLEEPEHNTHRLGSGLGDPSDPTRSRRALAAPAVSTPPRVWPGAQSSHQLRIAAGLALNGFGALPNVPLGAVVHGTWHERGGRDSYFARVAARFITGEQNNLSAFIVDGQLALGVAVRFGGPQIGVLLAAAGAMNVGCVSGIRRGVDMATRRTDLWLEAGAWIEAAVDLGGFSVWVQGNFGVPLTRPRFVLDDGTALFRASPISAGASAGFSLNYNL